MKTLDRRQLLSGGAALAVTVVVAGCDSSVGSEGGPTKEVSPEAREAPALAAMVQTGELPALAERLPAEPVVVEPLERTGVYGGTWRTVTTGVTDALWLVNTTGYERPLHFDFEAGELQPNIFESFQVNEDATEFTLTIRRGIKWSDGTPYTADDIVFWMDDIVGDEELTPVVPALMMAGGEPATVEKIDDLTVKFTFAVPNGLWARRLDGPIGTGVIFHERPRHYLEQFHRAYAENLDELLAEADVANWVELFERMADKYQNVDVPTLQPWLVTASLAENATRGVVERNPYYWKVDPDGRQLPYIDQVVFDLVSDVEAMVTRALNGDIDLHLRHFMNARNKPVLARGREDGNYRFFDVIPESACPDMIALNLTHPDATKREIFNNKDFRVGLSHAINREEVIATIHASQGEPYQVAPRPESVFYDEEFAKQYTEFDPDLANEHLDRVFPEVDGDGFRVSPDGGRFSFKLEVATGLTESWIGTAELLRGYWREVGIDMAVTNEERSLFIDRVRGNQHDAVIWGGGGGDKDILLRPANYVPGSGGLTYYAPGWVDWLRSNGKNGVEPPKLVQEHVRHYESIGATADPEEQESIMREVLQTAKEQFFVIGVSLASTGFGIVKNNFRNVPATMIASNLIPPPGNNQPSQYFIEGDS